MIQANSALFLSTLLLAKCWTTSLGNLGKYLPTVLHLRGLEKLVLEELLALLKLSDLIKDAFLCCGIWAHHQALMLHCLLFQICQVFMDSLLVERVRCRACCILEGRRQGSRRLERQSWIPRRRQCTHRIHDLLERAVWHIDAQGVVTLCQFFTIWVGHFEYSWIFIDIVYLLIEIIFALLAFDFALRLREIVYRTCAIRSRKIQVLIAYSGCCTFV